MAAVVWIIMIVKIKSTDEAATLQCAFLLAKHLPPSVIALDGDLGAGKTHFVQGLASGLGHKLYVSSPTFTLVQEYMYDTARLPLIHMDAYRLTSVDDWYEAGLDEYLNRRAVVVIEWAALIREALPPDSLGITISRTTIGNPAIEDVDGRIRLPEDNQIRFIEIDCPATLFAAPDYQAFLDELAFDSPASLTLEVEFD